MTGPGDPDDVDDVTLWAGRLRPWPSVPPATDDQDDVDATARSARGVEEDTVVSRRATEQTIVSTRRPDDDTVAARRASPPDDPTGPRRGEPAGATAPNASSLAPDDLDDDTGPRAVRREPASDLDDDTGPRAVRAEPAPDLDDDTGPRAVRPEPASDLDDDTGPRAVRRESASDLDDDTAVVGRRPALAPSALARTPDADVPDAATVDDETVRVGRAGTGGTPDEETSPRSRATTEPPVGRAALRRASAVDPVLGDAARREARVPAADRDDTYGPRPDEAVRVTRRVPERHPSTTDAGAVRPRSPRRGVAPLLIVAGCVLLLAVAGVAAVLLLGF